MDDQDKKTDGAEDSSTKNKKRTASVNADIWWLLSRNYLEDGVEMISEVMNAGNDISKLVIQRDTVLFNGEPVSVSTIAIPGFSVKFFQKDGENAGKYGYNTSRG